MSLRVGVIAAVVAMSGLCGCGGGPKLVPVSGTVTLNGKPMGDAQIMFLPDATNEAGLPGVDTTGPEGNYKVMTQGRAGLVPGKYKVVITKSTLDPSKIPPEFKDDPYMAKLVLEGPEAGPAAKPSRNTPESNEIKGEFESEVPDSGATLDYDVKAVAPKR